MSFFVYVYGEDGKHGKPVEVADDMPEALTIAMGMVVMPAVKLGREVIITDSDDCCVFEAIGGKILFPPVPS